MVRPAPASFTARGATRPDPATVLARRLLLDALDALAAESSAVVVGGGQAIDLRLPASPSLSPPVRRDGDLTLDVAALERPFPVGELLARAGFVLTGGPGHWARPANRILLWLARSWPVRVDVMLSAEPWPEAAGPDPRASEAAVEMPPMVLTLVDDDLLEASALDPTDERRRTARVAGLASLLLTKVHKFETRRLRAIARARPLASIGERDALDIVRILAHADDGLERGVRRIAAGARGRVVLRESIAFLEAHFGTPDALGLRLARAGCGRDADEGLLERASRRAVALAASGGAVAGLPPDGR